MFSNKLSASISSNEVCTCVSPLLSSTTSHENKIPTANFLIPKTVNLHMNVALKQKLAIPADNVVYNFYPKIILTRHPYNTNVMHV